MRHMLSNCQRLVIAGNSLSASTQSKDMHKQAKYLTKNFVAGSVGAIKQLDDFLMQITSKIDVDLMPGEFDPSNLMLPQQPLHHAMVSM
jgi:DNA polymerase delta subunit 2